MTKINAEQAMKELTMMLMYLSRFTEGETFDNAEEFYAWKGYSFGVINKLDEVDYIRQGSHKSKSVYLTTEGKAYAKELMERYGVMDWKES